MIQILTGMPLRKWFVPLLLVSGFIFILSLRQLSDPDLGFHLKYGKWIVTNHRIPVSDLSTYTVMQHPYIDLHWLFQVILYGVFRFAGYTGISLFVCLISLLLSLLLIVRQKVFGFNASITTFVILIAFLIIDPRIAPRPEMFTFLFLTMTLLILDLYSLHRKNLLFILPIMMLVWCNMHALFILGIMIIIIYFISIWQRDKKVDKALLIWTIATICVCFINPYGIRGFSLPLELLTRFDPGNIYNQHIQEFVPFFSQAKFAVRDYLFIIMVVTMIICTLFTREKRTLHDYILLGLFGSLALASIRNIPLFVLIAMPIISQQIRELTSKKWFCHKGWYLMAYILLIIIPVTLIPRVWTNAYYMSNNSFNKTGLGLNSSHQPLSASMFLLENHLDGRILNSIGFGGWLSWTLPQPVFIDGRLEVIQESLYREVTESWKAGLPKMIQKYHPQLIIYNYLKYYPWTYQLRDMRDWRLIYADGNAAIFAMKTYAVEIPDLDISKLASPDSLILSKTSSNWIQGLYKPSDYVTIEQAHLKMLQVQLSQGSKAREKAQKAGTFFNAANQKYNVGDIYGALADFDSAILLQPGYSKALNNRGILRAAAFHDYYGAISDFNKAIRINPHNGDAYLGRGTVFFMLNNRQSACNDWTIAHSLGNLQATRLIELHCR